MEVYNEDATEVFRIEEEKNWLMENGKNNMYPNIRNLM